MSKKIQRLKEVNNQINELLSKLETKLFIENSGYMYNVKFDTASKAHSELK